MQKTSEALPQSANDPKGCFMNKTNLFLERRKEQRSIAQAMLEMKRMFLEDHQSGGGPSSSSGYLTTLISRQPCKSCGYTLGLLNFSDTMPTCLKCQGNFCHSCIRETNPSDRCIEEFCGFSLTERDPAECNLCLVCDMYLREVQICRWKAIVAQLTEESSVVSVYNDLKALRGEIERVYPHYEYLATSILEVAPEKYDKAYAAIYSDVKVRQNQLWALMKKYQLEVKKFMEILPSNPTEAAVLKNIKADLSNYVQLRLPILKKYQQRIATLEVEGLSDVYVLLSQLENDMRALSSVWSTFGKAFDLCAQRVRSELHPAVSRANLSFDDHLKELDARIHDKSHVNDLKSLPVGTVIRKVAERIRITEKVILRRGIEAPIALDVLRYLAKTLEDTYDKSVSYSNWTSPK